MPKNSSQALLQKIREEYWPDEKLWTGKGVGWFQAPRTLPLIMALLSSKGVTVKQDVSTVYLDLLSRHYGGGVIQMATETDHAYAAGYWGERATRTWLERMKVLEDFGFIRSLSAGNDRYRYVALIHHAVVLEKLRLQGKIPDDWWNTYTLRRMDTKESDPE